METAVSIPSDIYQQAEELAKQLGLSSNQLFAQALEQWIKAQREAEINRRWEEVYSQEDSSLDPVLMQMQLTALEPEEW
jgi:predicted transcriptional regulator